MGEVRVKDRQDVTIYRDEFAYVSHPTVAKLHSGDYLVAFNESLVRQPFTASTIGSALCEPDLPKPGRWDLPGRLRGSLRATSGQVSSARALSRYRVERSCSISGSSSGTLSKRGASSRPGGNGSRRVPRVRSSQTAVAPVR